MKNKTQRAIYTGDSYKPFIGITGDYNSEKRIFTPDDKELQRDLILHEDEELYFCHDSRKH